MTPRPPSCAIAMARPDSVTVSMAALRIGTLSRIVRVRRVDTSTCDGFTVECCGTSSTSSNVNAVVIAVSVCSVVENGAVFRSIESSYTQKADDSSASDPSRGLPVAFLVFLSAPTGARIVAANFRLFPADSLDHVVTARPCRNRVLRPCWTRTRRPGKCRHGCRAGVVRRHCRHGWPPWCRSRGRRGLSEPLIHRHWAKPEEVSHDFLFDAPLHILEERVALLLVLNERIALSVAAKSD